MFVTDLEDKTGLYYKIKDARHDRDSYPLICDENDRTIGRINITYSILQGAKIFVLASDAATKVLQISRSNLYSDYNTIVNFNNNVVRKTKDKMFSYKGIKWLKDQDNNKLLKARRLNLFGGNWEIDDIKLNKTVAKVEDISILGHECNYKKGDYSVQCSDPYKNTFALQILDSSCDRLDLLGFFMTLIYHQPSDAC